MNVKEIGINFISLSTVYIEILSETGAKLSNATGFLYEYNGNIFMITNKHIVTGRNIETGKPLSPTCAIPQKMILYIPNILSIKDSPTGKKITYVKNEINLIENQKEKWLSHFDDKIDVVAFKFNILSGSSNVYFPINSYDFSNFQIRVSDNIFVIGYPVGIIGGTGDKMFPIWKRGSVATEPEIDYGTLPRFIIDTSTREGMSGSPVVGRHDGVITSGENGEMLGDDYIGVHYNFVGIYSGRLNSKLEEDNFTTQLGIVWKEKVINEILERYE